jgi:nicotinate phosphoribosyltransferase
MVQVAGGRPLAEMGSRRTGERSAVAAARAAFIAGFSATSNLEAGRTWGVPTMGTAAHSFTLLHDTEEQAFRAQVEALGAGTTLLVDTYDVRQGVETAVRVAGTGLGAVRLDSGDLPVLVGEVRAQLDALGATGTRITVTNDLDEHGIAGLAASPVDSYGVGTSLVTGSGAPAAGMVFKLVAHRDAGGRGEWVPVAKRSTGKQSRGGLKGALRRHDAQGTATSELVTVGPHPAPLPGDRDLLVTLVEDGEPDPRWLGRAGTAAARAPRTGRARPAGAGVPPARRGPGDPDRAGRDRLTRDPPGSRATRASCPRRCACSRGTPGTSPGRDRAATSCRRAP